MDIHFDNLEWEEAQVNWKKAQKRFFEVLTVKLDFSKDFAQYYIHFPFEGSNGYTKAIEQMDNADEQSLFIQETKRIDKAEKAYRRAWEKRPKF